jgi:hypothetical protein
MAAPMPLPLPMTGLSADDLVYLVLLSAFVATLVGLTVILREAARSSGSPRPRMAVLWVKSPGEMELRSAKLAKTGEIMVTVGNDTWIYRPPTSYKPMELKVGSRLYKVYIVDKNIHAFYEIPEIDDSELNQEVEVNGRRIQLNRVMLDPRTLFAYIGGKSMEKLIKPLRVSKGEAVGYMAMGGLLVLLMIFFFLPMLGYHVSIGGGGPFG